MPRTALSVITPKGPYPAEGSIGANDLDFSFTAGDDANGNEFTFTGKELIVIRNSHGSSAATVTISSAADAQGRKADITSYSLAAGEFAVFWAGAVTGWRQSDGKFYLDSAGTGTIEYAIIRIP